MRMTDRRWLRGLLLGVVYTLGLIGIVASGGGGGGGDDDEPSTVSSRTVGGGGVKGPLANAIVTVYAFDPTQPGFKGAVIATATTNASAAIVGLSIPTSATPPLIIEFTSNAGTTDITTNMAPVVPTMRSVITQTMLDSGESIYATPLTTMGVDIAIAASGPATTGAQFEAALAAAATQVVSTLGFGMRGSLDIYRTPPLVNNATDTVSEQTDVAAYRSSVEALTAIVFAIDQQASGDANAALLELSLDLADGTIDGIVGGNPSNVFSSTALDVLGQNPAMLVIPNTAPPRTVAEVQSILVAEKATTGSTTPTTELEAGGSITTTTRPAETSTDSDGDGTPNSADAFPYNPSETVDSDGDGIGDNADPDDDNNGILDEDEGVPPAPTPTDTDGDGFVDGADNCPLIFNPSQTNTDGQPDGGDACDVDDDNDGTPDTNDAFPLNATEQRDADGDGIGDIADTDDDNDGRSDSDENSAPADPDGDGIPNREDIDSDNDGVLDKVDFAPYDAGVTLNQAPVVADSSVTTDEDVAVAVTLDVTDDGVAPGALVFNITGPTNGVLSGTAPNLTYTPNPQFSGNDSFTFTATDGAGKTSAVATVSITVSPVNDDPVIDQAGPLEVTMDEDGVPTGFAAPVVTASDADGDPLTWSGGAASHGNATISGTGASPTISYTPNANFFGDDSFDVIVDDGNGGSDSITINVTVDPVNDAPVIDQAGPLEVTMDEDGAPTAFAAPVVTASDADGDPLNWSGSVASNGTANVSGSGASPTIDYTPDADFFGDDSFDVTVSDGTDSDTITINVTVDPVNDDPVAVDDVAVTLKNIAVTTGNVLLNDTDVDGDLLSVAAGNPAAANGTVVNNNDGTFTYTPNADYFGPDSFNYTVNDGNGGSDIGTVDVTVNADTGPAIWNQFNWDEGTWQ